MGYAPHALDFDGSSDYLTRGSNLTGIADGQLGIVSFWFRLDGGDDAEQRLVGNVSRFHASRLAGNTIQAACVSAVGAALVNLITTPTYTVSTTWLHLLASWDLTVPTASLYIDDAAPALGTETVVGGTDIDYTHLNNFGVAARPDNGTLKFNGAMSELYFNSTEYLDISVESNRRKFIDASSNPVWLGTDGSLPTGTAPILYMNMHTTGTNLGSGGNFTDQGSTTGLVKGPVEPKIHTARVGMVL